MVHVVSTTGAGRDASVLCEVLIASASDSASTTRAAGLLTDGGDGAEPQAPQTVLWYISYRPRFHKETKQEARAYLS
jgi:hypothetical protein